MAVIFIGTLDTKGHEVAFVRDLVSAAGFRTIVIDAGSGGPPLITPDIERSDVHSWSGESKDSVGRGQAVAAAARGAEALLTRLAEQGGVEGIFGLGGSAGTTIASAAMRAVPFGVPKVLVSTLASGQTRPYLAGSDITLVPAIADIAGLNRITRNVLTNAAGALLGMLQVRGKTPTPPSGRLVVAASMFGVTTPCVGAARRILEAAGCEVIVFHATGVGGEAMERLIGEGEVDGVLDITTTELADELVGGILSAGPDRLRAAATRGVPQVVSVGALDMVNFGPMNTIPERFKGRLFCEHNPTVTLMRTTIEENAELGRRIAATLRDSIGPSAIALPRGGVSEIDRPGQPFFDESADRELFVNIREGLRGSSVDVIERAEHINDPAFAELLAVTLLRMMGLDRRN